MAYCCRYYVVLKHAPNPDIITGGYWVSPLDELKRVYIKTFREASEACRKYIERNELGSGNWTGGQIFYDIGEHGEPIAHVSYNGRVWDMNDEEIPLEPL